jgi:hypothetical protein
MIDNEYSREISNHRLSKMKEAIQHEKATGQYTEAEDMEMPNNTITHLTGYDKHYKKQVPIIASGKHTMEMADKVKGKKGGRPAMSKRLGMIYQSQLDNFEGGSGEQDEIQDTNRDLAERAMGGSFIAAENLHTEVKQDDLQRHMGGSKSDSKGRMKARALKIKEVMKEQGLSMIQASKYIKEHKIVY